MASAESSASGSRSGGQVLLGALTATAGAAILAYEIWIELYLVLITAVVAVSVWLMLGKTRRPLAQAQKRTALVAGIAMGFWVFTTTALRLADSSGTEDGAGASSVVTVSPRGNELGAREIMTGGIVSTLGGAALAYGALKLRKRSRKGRRHRLNSVEVSNPAESAF